MNMIALGGTEFRMVSLIWALMNFKARNYWGILEFTM